MENKLPTESQKIVKPLNVYIDSEIAIELEPFDLSQINLTDKKSANLSIFKKDHRLWVQYPNEEFCDYPYYIKNVVSILKSQISLHQKKFTTQYHIETPLKNLQNIEKRIFTQIAVRPEDNIKDYWDEIIKKVNSISVQAHTLKSLMEKILEIGFLQSFHTSLVVLHIKGQSKAQILGTMWRSENVQEQMSAKDFNLIYSNIKKSKLKSFTTDSYASINLPFNGSFLAKDVTSKKYSLIAIASRHDFLSYSHEEIDLFETCIDLLQPHFERLIDQEFSDKKVSELRMCLKDFPLPLRIKDSLSDATFINDLYQHDLQEQDIFFNKKVKGVYTLDLYDSDELRHYAFDLFHFQRISLLGELLNTLRHELSNPLFGLKLSSQIFASLDIPEDDKIFMEEIEKNINRCQVIIENFSNLYQIQAESKSVNVKKMIDESLVLAKSEIREITKTINFYDRSDEVDLNVPIIFVIQILFNLIVNSAQAMKSLDRRGELGINVHINHDLLEIYIHDNGPGIPPSAAQNLFKPFYTTKAYGTGLGLVLSRNLALKMGGNLEYCPMEGIGSRFKITLPIT